MRKLTYLILCVQISLIISCTDEINVATETVEKEGVIIDENILLVDGRMTFTDDLSFKDFYGKAIASTDDKFISEMENKIYSKDFYSLMPNVNEKNEIQQFERHFNKVENSGIQSKTSKGKIITKKEFASSLDGLEDIFGEELFASLINQDGELQVGDKIYKYTDTGLFIVTKKQIANLNEYLIKKGISLNFLNPTPENIKRAYINEVKTTSRIDCDEEFLTSFDDQESGLNNVQFFIAEDNCGGGSGGGSGGSGSSNPRPTPTPVNNFATSAEIEIALRNINPCEVQKPWLSNIFGEVNTCYDQYDGDHRVKVNYFFSNYLLAFHVGAKSKHQKKGWTGLWRKQNADQMVTGVNSVTWSYKHPITTMPQYSFPTFYHLSDGKLYSTFIEYNKSIIQDASGEIPFLELPFVRASDVIVEFVLDGNYGIETEKEVSEAFYGFIFDRAKGLFKNLAKKELRTVTAVVTGKTKTWIQYYDFSYNCLNCDKFDITFDWGVATPKINYTFGTGSGFNWGNFKFSNFDFDFKRPESTGITMYTIVKRGGKWHGSKMIIE